MIVKSNLFFFLSTITSHGQDLSEPSMEVASYRCSEIFFLLSVVWLANQNSKPKQYKVVMLNISTSVFERRMSQLFTYKYKSNVKTFPKYADIIFAILLAPAHMWLGSTATEDDLTLRIRTFSCYMLTMRSSLCWKTHDNGHKPHSSVQKDSESCHLQNTICRYRQLPLSTVSDNHLKMQKDGKRNKNSHHYLWHEETLYSL